LLPVDAFAAPVLVDFVVEAGADEEPDELDFDPQPATIAAANASAAAPAASRCAVEDPRSRNISSSWLAVSRYARRRFADRSCPASPA
jgi:hypothetical protein